MNLFQLGAAAFTQAESVWTSLDVQLIQRAKELVKVFKTAPQMQAVSFIHHRTN
jgi:hypothetical protein